MLLTPLRSSWSHLVVALKERLSVEKIFASGFEETPRKFYWTPINFLSSGYIHLPGNRPKFNFCQCFSLGCTSPALSFRMHYDVLSFPGRLPVRPSSTSVSESRYSWSLLFKLSGFVQLRVLAAVANICAVLAFVILIWMREQFSAKAILCQRIKEVIQGWDECYISVNVNFLQVAWKKKKKWSNQELKFMRRVQGW